MVSGIRSEAMGGVARRDCLRVHGCLCRFVLRGGSARFREGGEAPPAVEGGKRGTPLSIGHESVDFIFLNMRRLDGEGWAG